MAAAHKNKTLTSFLAFSLGGLGAHRFYLRGMKDRWAWLHLSCVPATLLIAALAPQADIYYKILPIIISFLIGYLAALVLGLIADDKWDATCNAHSGKQSASSWPLALLLVASLLMGSGGLIAAISRLFDLLYTGGAYG